MKNTQAKQEKMTRLTFELSVEEHRKIKAFASLKGQTMRDYILSLIFNNLQKKPNKKVVWVKIFSTGNQVHANRVRRALEDSKIPCFMFNESLDWYPPNPWASTEFELSVPSEYFQEAFCLVVELREKLGFELEVLNGR